MSYCVMIVPYHMSTMYISTIFFYRAQYTMISPTPQGHVPARPPAGARSVMRAQRPSSASQWGPPSTMGISWEHWGIFGGLSKKN